MSCPTHVFRRILRKKYGRAGRTHYGPTRIQQAGFSLCHRRDGSAGTTILQLVSASDDRTKALISDYGLAGGCWSKRNVAASAGAAGPFYGTTGRRKQRVAVAELSVPQDLCKDHGPTGSCGRRRRLRGGRSTSKGLRARRICRMAMPE